MFERFLLSVFVSGSKLRLLKRNVNLDLQKKNVNLFMSNPFNVNLGNGWSVQPGNSNSPFPNTPFIPPRGAEVHYQPNSSSNYYAGGYSQGKNTGVYAGFRMKF